MKEYNKWLWMACFMIGTACSDDSMPEEVTGGGTPGGNEEEWVLPDLPPVSNTKDRAMWVSYDPTPGSVSGSKSGISSALISWRLFKTDGDIAFNIYKKVGDGEEVKLNESPITESSCWVDAKIDPEATNYYRVTQANSTEGEPEICKCTFTPEMAKTFYREITLNTNVPDPSLNYLADDAQVADLDGDGQMEIVLKREAYDGANQGGWHNGTTLIEAYKLDGTFMWQIDLGINIRCGSHYTSYIVADFDGDGRSEIAFRTSEGTRFADGKTIVGANGKVNDYRIREDSGGGWYTGSGLPNLCGLILESPEYISVCRGADGREITRMANIPRGGSGSRKERAEYWAGYWGDDYGNRMDRFFIGAAYLDGIPNPKTADKEGRKPSLIVTRGVYANWQVWAVDLQGNELVTRWKFDTIEHSKKWQGMCSHCFRVADLDEDGYDEILYGQAAIRRDGTEFWCTGNGHGDALHVGKFIKDRPGLQIVASFESPNTYNNQGHGYGCEVIDARDGSHITGHAYGGNADVGRCIVADVDPNSPNFEYWSSVQEGMFNCSTGELLSKEYPSAPGGGASYNMAIYWTGELTRQMLDKSVIESYTASKLLKRKRIVSFYDYGGGVSSNHSSKASPCYYGDFLGDYREEVIYRANGNKSLYIFSTNHPTEYRFPHLMEDHNYDMTQAMQNTGYNQPNHLGFYVGAEMEKKEESTESGK